MKLKIFVIMGCVAILLLPLGCASHSSFADTDVTALKETGVEKKSDKEKIEALSEEDPRRQRIMTLTWQIQYQRERLKSLELQYLAACYKDKEYRDALAAIETLNKQIRRLMLL